MNPPPKFPLTYKHYTVRLGPKVFAATSDVMVAVMRAESWEPGHEILSVACPFLTSKLRTAGSDDYENLIIEMGWLSLKEMIDKFCISCDPVDEEAAKQPKGDN